MFGKGGSLLLSLKEQEEKLLQQGESGRNEGYLFIDDVKRCWYIWNLYNPNDEITTGDDCCIHHKDEDKLNDHIWNLQKMTKGEHSRLHHSGEKSHFYGQDHSGKKNGMYGRDCSDEKGGFYGCVQTEEAKQKHSEFMTDRYVGENNSNAKTTKKEVIEMRRIYDEGETIKNLIMMFNSTRNTVSKIVHKVTWRHI